MGSDIQPLGELFAEQARNGLTRPKAVRGVGTKMVNMGELFAHRRLRNVAMDRVPLSDSEADRFLLKPGDLLFARQSLVLEGAGKCSIFLQDEEPVTFESHVTRVRLDRSKADPGFYFYYFQSPRGRAAIRSIVEQGAGAAGIRGSDLAFLPVVKRPLEEQHAATHVLGTLDDKIDLIRRMNQTLEEIARAIFRAWFVDFDPVRAKGDGRDPALGFPEPLGELFPDTLRDSELGPIPRGWEVRPIGEVVEVVGGSTPSTTDPAYWGGRNAFATPKDLSGLSAPILLKTKRTVTEKGAEQISSGVLPPGTVLLSSRAPIGYVAIARVPVCVNQGFIAMVCDSELPSHYVAEWAKLNVDTFKQNAGGTTFAEISKRIFRPLPVLVPPKHVLDAFERVAGSLYTRIEDNLREVETLGALRDTLLPRLISGELRLKEPEGLARVAT